MSDKIIKISSTTRQAKYRQIINSIINALANGKLKRGDKIPSINDIAGEFGLSRDTVMLAYNELKARGVISSVPGLGYFIESTNVQYHQKIFLLFDEFNAFKENLYNSFIETFDGKAHVDIFFHHFNKRVFESLIKDNVSRYTTFVILPANLQKIASIIKVLPQEKVFIIDQLPVELSGKYPAVYQDFEEEIYSCLESGIDLLKKYHSFIMVYPGGKEPIGFMDGFKRFCHQYNLKNEILPNLRNRTIQQGEVYILPNDRDLVTIVKSAEEKNLKIGKELGIISINDMPLKEVVAGGITTISTDFNEMGRTMANIIMENCKKEIKNPSRLIIRNSL
jgi:DNA-binding transcriptional regulator YhcF (GntR family)